MTMNFRADVNFALVVANAPGISKLFENNAIFLQNNLKCRKNVRIFLI